MRILVALLLAGAASPALAQHVGHGAHQPAPQQNPHAGHKPAQPQADPHAGHQQPGAQQGDPHAAHWQPQPAGAQPDPHAGHQAPPPTSSQPDPHAGHQMPQPAPVQADPHAGHQMPQPQPGQADPHAGHQPAQQDPHAGHQPAQQPPVTADPHAGHRMGGAAAATDVPLAPPPPEALSGPSHAADAFYGDAQMAEARRETAAEMGGVRTWKVLFDQLEVGFGEGRETYTWEDAQFWYGGDINKLWIKSQGEGTFGERVESAEVQALWSRAITPFFDLQTGIRYDFRPDPERAYLVLGLQGLAPYWFEVDTALFLSTKGDVSGRVEVEYDQRITQALIFQPRVEADFALQDVPELGVGSGLSTAELGARLRYEFYPEAGPAVIAPYVGVQYERAFGDTADFRRAAGEDVGGWSLRVGLRTWF